MAAWGKILSGGDLRSIGKSNVVVSKIKNQNNFDELFNCLFHTDRLVVMRAADAIEKITIPHPEYLIHHRKKIFALLTTAINIELKWHLALLTPRLPLNKRDFNTAWDILMAWAKDKTNSRLVRVGAVQGLFEMTKQENSRLKDFNLIMLELEKETIPSINARIRNIRKEISVKQKSDK